MRPLFVTGTDTAVGKTRDETTAESYVPKP